MTGKVTNFVAKKGYGFIKGEDGESYFVHQTSINMEGFRALRRGQKVEFTPGENEKGKTAESVTVM